MCTERDGRALCGYSRICRYLLFVTHQPVDYTKQLAEAQAEAAKQMCKLATITKVSNAKVNLSVHSDRDRDTE